MNVALVVITDGRGEYLEQTVASFRERCDYPFATTVLVDDSADDEYDAHARSLVQPTVTVFHDRRCGGASAVQSAWRALQRESARLDGLDYVFHLEDDWTFPGPVPVQGMIDVLEADPWLANIVLRRQPAPMEPSGGYIGANPALFDQRASTGEHVELYLEHKQGFWLNPCVYPYRVTFTEWPDNGHEHHYSARLLSMGYRFAVYGTHADPPRCWHIGVQRSNAWTW